MPMENAIHFAMIQEIVTVPIAMIVSTINASPDVVVDVQEMETVHLDQEIVKFV